MKLSSKHLFHFTRKSEYLLSIVEKKGFEYRELAEDLPLTGYQGSVFSFPGIVIHQFKWKAVCFCDIPEHTIADHSNQYGAYGICLSKQWGMDMGLTPIRYVHYKTPDLNRDEFYSIKNTLSTMQRNGGSFFWMIAYMLNQKEGIPLPTKEELDALPGNIQRYFSQIDMEIGPLLQHPMQYLGLMRRYEGDWEDRVTGVKMNRVFYDEKEWRAIKVDENDENLIFDYNDVEALILPNDQELQTS